MNDANDDILYRASLKSSELVSSAAASASAAPAAADPSSRDLMPLAKILLMIAIGGYTFNVRTLNAARVEGDPFDRAPGERGQRDSSSIDDTAFRSRRDDNDAAAPEGDRGAALRGGDDDAATFPFPSLYRSLVYLQYDNPRTLKELTCLSIRWVLCMCLCRCNLVAPLPRFLMCMRKIPQFLSHFFPLPIILRHCASHVTNSNLFYFASKLPLPKVIQQNVVDLCETLVS